jgi:SNF2 family DNA or RNA helicase
MLDLTGQGLSQRGIAYQRLDGTKSLAQRERALKQFRSDPNCEVLLATLGAGGVGYVSGGGYCKELPQKD